MGLFLILPWLAPPGDWKLLASLGALVVVLAMLAFLALRLGKANEAKTRMESQVADLSRELEKSSRTLHEALAAIENENFTDPVTDLRNRRYLSAIIRADIAKVQRVYRDSPPETLVNQDLVFFMVDLDHYSRIGEYYGASVADQVLVSVAQALSRIFRETDAVIRWGGDEFLVVARNTNRRDAPELAERIRTVVAGLLVETSKGEVLRWTCSIGFAAFPFQPSDFGWLGWDRVVEIANTCLEVAKKTGRNAWLGAGSLKGLDRARHGPRIPGELKQLADEGVLEILSSRVDPFGKSQKVGEILG